jgi:DNA-binding MarR family transcriptional regulator
LTKQVDINIFGDVAEVVPLAITHQVRDTCLCLHLRRAARVVARRFDDALRPLGLTSGQFSLLMALNAPKPPTIGRVADLLAMDRTTLTANLKPLARRGLATIGVDSVDRRSRRLKLTRSGRALLARAVPVWKRTHAAVEGLLGQSIPDDFRSDLRLLSREGAPRLSADPGRLVAPTGGRKGAKP